MVDLIQFKRAKKLIPCHADALELTLSSSIVLRQDNSLLY